ncbi:hypothetical protein PGB90_006691 [Kerria lacca]
MEITPSNDQDSIVEMDRNTDSDVGGMKSTVLSMTVKNIERLNWRNLSGGEDSSEGYYIIFCREFKELDGCLFRRKHIGMWCPEYPAISLIQ